MFTRTLGIVTIRFVVNMEKGVRVYPDSFEAGPEKKNYQIKKALYNTCVIHSPFCCFT